MKHFQRADGEYMTEKDILQLISDKIPEMSKGHVKIAEYVTKHLDEAAFETASKLGRKIGVSESTVVRFAMKLGFEGYPEYQKALEDVLKRQMDTIKKLDEKYGGTEDSDVYRQVIARDIDNLQKTAKGLNPIAFNMAISILLDCDNVYVMGHGNNEPLAELLRHHLSLARKNVFLINDGSLSENFEKMLYICENDCFVGIGFSSYSMQTMKCMEFANDRNAKVISLSDDIHSPMNFYSSCNLVAVSEMNPLIDSLVAPLSVINSMIIAIYLKRREEIDGNMRMLDKVCDTYKAFGEDKSDFSDDNEDLV